MTDFTNDAAANAPKAKRVASAIAFPYSDLADAISVAEGMRNGGGVALTRDQLAAAMGLAPRGGGFATKIATAKLFGLVDTAGGKYELTDLGYEIMDAARHQEAKVSAFMNVPLYKRIYDEFRGRLLPPKPHGLEKAIVNFGVTEKLARTARQPFERSARLAGLFPNSNEDRLVMPVLAQSGSQPDEDEGGVVEAVGAARRSAAPTAAPLEYQLVDLLKTEGIDEDVSAAIWTIVRFLSTR